MQHMAMIQSAWRPLLPPSATEQNKLLSRMMQQVTQGDPYAYTIFKQDGKEFMWVITCSPTLVIEHALQLPHPDVLPGTQLDAPPDAHSYVTV